MAPWSWPWTWWIPTCWNHRSAGGDHSRRSSFIAFRLPLYLVVCPSRWRHPVAAPPTSGSSPWCPLSVSPFFGRSKHTQRLQLLPENARVAWSWWRAFDLLNVAAQLYRRINVCYPVVPSIRRRSATCCRLQDAKERVSCWFRVFSNVDVIIWWTDTESALGHGLVSISIQIPCAWLCWTCLPPKLAFLDLLRLHVRAHLGLLFFLGSVYVWVRHCIRV
jgi:hypothetical protein